MVDEHLDVKALEAVEFPRMRMLDARLAEVLSQYEAEHSVQAVARGIGGHCYFLMGRERGLYIAPEENGGLDPRTEIPNIYFSGDVPGGGIGWDDAKAINDEVEQWLASPTVDRLSAAEAECVLRMERDLASG